MLSAPVFAGFAGLLAYAAFQFRRAELALSEEDFWGLMLCLALLPFALPAYADSIRNAEWHLAFLNMTKAWEVSQGNGVTVAVIDSGVDGSHHVGAQTEPFADIAG